MMGTAVTHPPVQRMYLAHTNQGFLLREVSVVAERLLEGATKAEVSHGVMEDDLFQLPATTSRKTSLQAVWKRLEGVPTSLLTLLATGSLDQRRLTNLYLILLRHRLLREFITEVVVEALSRFAYTVPPTEVNAFMVHKRNQVPEIDAWSEATASKARSNLVNLCVSAGLLQKVKGELSVQPQSVPPALREELASAERQAFLRLLLDSEAL